MNSEAIVCEGLVKSFGAAPVLRGLNLSVHRGELFIVMGLSGSGKSVLLKHLLRLYQPDAGRIFINGQDLAAMAPADMEAYLRRVGMVFQHAALFDSLTTGENVAFPMREHSGWDEAEIRARVERLLDRVHLPGQYDKPSSALSGGMRKRAGIARGLALEPEFVFYDEPTSGLDPVTGTAIEDLILETHRDFGYTGLVITHSWEQAQKLAHRMALIWNGQARMVGTPTDIAASDDPVVQGFLRRDARLLERAEAAAG